MNGMPPVSAARLTLVLTMLVAFSAAASAPAQVSKASVTLLAPGNGTLVQGAVAFRWRVDSDAATAQGSVTVTHQVAADVAFTQNVMTTTRSCPATNLNCWASIPGRTLRGRHYWRVSLSGAVTAVSATWMFQVVSSGGYTPDRTRPRVRAYPGAGTRGRKAVFVARVADDRGEARMQVDLAHRNQLIFRTVTLQARALERQAARRQPRAALAQPRAGPVSPLRHRLGPHGQSCAELRPLRDSLTWGDA
jgi:hypothetical protein